MENEDLKLGAAGQRISKDIAVSVIDDLSSSPRTLSSRTLHSETQSWVGDLQNPHDRKRTSFCKLSSDLRLYAMTHKYT